MKSRASHTAWIASSMCASISVPPLDLLRGNDQFLFKVRRNRFVHQDTFRRHAHLSGIEDAAKQDLQGTHSRQRSIPPRCWFEKIWTHVVRREFEVGGGEHYCWRLASELHDRRSGAISMRHRSNWARGGGEVSVPLHRIPVHPLEVLPALRSQLASNVGRPREVDHLATGSAWRRTAHRIRQAAVTGIRTRLTRTSGSAMSCSTLCATSSSEKLIIWSAPSGRPASANKLARALYSWGMRMDARHLSIGGLHRDGLTAHISG
jgi:hypothetical protein